MSTEQRLRDLLARRILILDGAMGAMIQRHRLTEEQFRGGTGPFRRRFFS